MLNRGFTAHEMLDVHGLVHMNGRVYDPELGRFLSADPLVQFPHSTQGLDRYSYVHNNPLSYTDPSGHLVFFLVAAVYAATHASLQFLAINIMLAAVAGYLETGTLRGALFSALSAGFAGGVGALMQELGSFAGAWFVQAALHGLVQGTLAAAQGGRWRAGFAAGFFGSAAGGFNPGRFGGAGTAAMVLRVLKAAVVGGTAARLGGGKFANGAVTGAFVQAFNHGQHDEATDQEPTGPTAVGNPDGSVTITYPDGSTETRIGGTRAWRNNNPGNVRMGSSRSVVRATAIGEAGGFAVFPDYATGRATLGDLLSQDFYQNLTVNDAITRFAPPVENNTAAYQGFVSRSVGVPGTRLMSSLSSQQFQNTLNTIQRMEGWREGDVIRRPGP